MHDVFISYAHEDRNAARALADRFSAHGLKVWWDDELRAGDDWSQTIMGTLDTVRFVVTLWSPSSVASEWVSLESGYALVKKKLVPAKILPVETPSPFRSIQEADLIGWPADRESDLADEFALSMKRRLALLRDVHSEPSVRRQLSQLRQDLRHGGRFIVAALVAGVPLMILSGLLWAHFEAVVQGQDVPRVPANFVISGSSQVMLTILTGGLGWAGWLLLRSAAKLQHRLEFDLNVSNEQIGDALAGSSIVSTSPGFVKILCLAFCLGSLFTSVTAVAAMAVSILLKHGEYFETSLLVFDWIAVLPFFLIAFITQLKWFSPSGGNILPRPLRWWMTRYARQGFEQLLLDVHANHSFSSDESARLHTVLHEAAENIWSALDRELATEHRRLRSIRFLREFLWGTLFEDALSRVLPIELWKTADRALPDRSPQDQLRILLRFFA